MNDRMSIHLEMANYYRKYYGDETDHLLHALANPPEKIALLNPWLASGDLELIVAEAQKEIILDNVFYRLPKTCAPRLMGGLLSHYFLDRSSTLPALGLPVAPHSRVLDMCAAPGGKLLVMMSRQVNDVHFLANDISRARGFRLKQVVESFVPKTHRMQSLSLSTKDAHYFSTKELASFDVTLLDAPCSSDAHVLVQGRRFERPQKSLPFRQYSLLAAALLSVKPGGYVMYATCTINPAENDAIIEKALDKKHAIVSLIPLTLPMGDSGPFGVTILPHRHNAGPAFLSLLRRLC